MTDNDIEWFMDGPSRWARMERKFSALVIQFAGTSFAFLLGLILVPSNVWLTALCGAMLWIGVAMICFSAAEVERCRRWRDWHETLQADPMAWPWPPMPSEA